jgi:hypothetical protein
VILLLDGGVTIDIAVALGIITASVGGLVGAITVLYKALSTAYGRQIDDLRAERDRYRELAELSARQVGRSVDVADRTVTLAEKRTPR